MTANMTVAEALERLADNETEDMTPEQRMTDWLVRWSNQPNCGVVDGYLVVNTHYLDPVETRTFLDWLVQQGR